MRSTIVAAAALALTGLGASPVLAHTPAAEPTTAPGATSATESEHQRGVVLECRGAADGLSAYVNLYENNLHGNYFQVILDDDPRLARSRTPRDLLDQGEVRATMRIKKAKVRVTGTAHRVGKRTHVHEEVDDAGQHVVSDGFHRRLAHDLTLTYRGTTVPLRCAPAFFYSLAVTTTDTAD